MVKVSGIKISKGRKRKLYGTRCVSRWRVGRVLITYVTYHWKEL